MIRNNIGRVNENEKNQQPLSPPLETHLERLLQQKTAMATTSITSAHKS